MDASTARKFSLRAQRRVACCFISALVPLFDAAPASYSLLITGKGVTFWEATCAYLHFLMSRNSHDTVEEGRANRSGRVRLYRRAKETQGDGRPSGCWAAHGLCSGAYTCTRRYLTALCRCFLIWNLASTLHTRISSLYWPTPRRLH